MACSKLEAKGLAVAKIADSRSFALKKNKGKTIFPLPSYYCEANPV
jgi:hypothetical protein